MYEGPATDELDENIHATLHEMSEGSEEDKIGSLLLTRRLESEQPEHYLLARANDGTLAAILIYTPLTEEVVQVPFFTVAKQYRGMGLFRLLFDAFSRQMARFHYKKMIVNLAGSRWAGSTSPRTRRATPPSSDPLTESWNSCTPAWKAPSSRLKSSHAYYHL